MTIEEIPESVRCPDCSTWLPRAALECPKCGRPRDLAVTGPPGRSPPSRRLMIGGGAAAVLVLGGVILWTLAPRDEPESSPGPTHGSQVALISPSAEPTPRVTPTNRPLSSRTAAPSRSPTPTAVPVPQVRAPLFLSTEIPDMGRRATVLAPGPRVRDVVETESDRQIVLGAGSQLLLRDGPIAVDGYDWYWAYFPPSAAANQLVPLSGWVAAGPSGQVPTLMEIGPVRCLAVPTTVALMGSMTDMARRECLGAGSFEVHGVVEQCSEMLPSFWVYEPAWIRFDCYYVIELGTTAYLQLHFPPSVSVPGTLVRGDLVRLVGHVNDRVAADCQVVPPEDAASGSFTPEQQRQEQEQFVLRCRSAFVVTEIEVTGHIDLWSPFGF